MLSRKEVSYAKIDFKTVGPKEALSLTKNMSQPILTDSNKIEDGI